MSERGREEGGRAIIAIRGVEDGDMTELRERKQTKQSCCEKYELCTP